jgi:lipopolysaccharide transport system permease protein
MHTIASTFGLLNSRDLLLEWTSRNIRARYQQSYLGWLWAIAQPVAQALTFSAVFTLVVPVDTAAIPYVVFSYVAIVPWTLLAMSLPEMTNSIVDNMALITKIYFPREILPIAALLARLLDSFVAAMLVVPMLLAFHIAPSPLILLTLPIVLAIQLMLLLGLGLACAALNVFFRDVRSLLLLGLQIWFYVSPVLYPTSMVPEQMKPYYFLNPMAGIIVAYRDIVLEGRLPGDYLGTSALVSFLVLLLGYGLFKYMEGRFADVI